MVLARRLLSTSPTRKFRYLQNKGTSLLNLFLNSAGTQKISPRHIDRRNVLSTQLVKRGRSECDKLDRRRSPKLTISPSSDVRPLQFIAEIVKLFLEYDSVARVSQRQLILVLLGPNSITSICCGFVKFLSLVCIKSATNRVLEFWPQSTDKQETFTGDECIIQEN